MSAELRTREEILRARVEIPDGVVLRGFVTETVVLNLGTGMYHALNPTGGRMLDVLVQAENVERAAEALAAEYARDRAEIVADLCEFCCELERRRLIELRDGD
jgi:hypothetical protein